MTFRSFLVLIFLALAVPGCLTSSPTPAGGVPENVRSEAPPSSSDAVVGPVASNGSNVLGPRVDSERVGQETVAYTAFFGPGFTQPVSGGIFVFDGHFDLPLLVNKQTTNLDQGTVKIQPEPGLQIRLIHDFTDRAGARHFRSCDTMTGEVQPDGRNAAFTGISAPDGGRVHLFVVKPGPTVVIPTADFSAACVDLSEADRQAYVWEDMVVSAGRYEPLGTLQLTPAIDLGPTPTGFGATELPIP